MNAITTIPTLEAYLPFARRTLKELPFQKHLEHMSLGFCGEMGEILDGFKKNLAYGKPLDMVNMAEEIGDVAWYVVNILPDLGLSMRAADEIFQVSLDELHKSPQLPIHEVTSLLVLLNEGFAGLAALYCVPPLNTSAGSAEAIESGRSLIQLFASLVAVWRFDPATIFQANIAKLQKRYGDKFSDFAALNRDLDGERATLEANLAPAVPQA